MYSIWKKLPLIIVSLSYLILGYLFFDFIYRYSIRVPYGDEFIMVSMVIDKIRPQNFFTQLNEHRMGTSTMLFQLLSHVTHWNLLYETMSTGILIGTTSLIALWLKNNMLNQSIISTSSYP